METILDEKNFTHLQVNHFENFVTPDNGAHSINWRTMVSDETNYKNMKLLEELPKLPSRKY